MIIDSIKADTFVWMGAPADLERGVRLIWEMNSGASVRLLSEAIEALNETTEALTEEGRAQDGD